MKKLYFFSLALFSVTLFFLSGCSAIEAENPSTYSKNIQSEKKAKDPQLKPGDIIFQTSSSGQSKAVQIATRSKYSHTGLILERNGALVVCEAVQPVKYTPLKAWIKRGDYNHYAVKRLRNSEDLITQTVLDKMAASCKKFVGKNYDIHFGWSDEKIYCSELVWKVYHDALGIEIGKLEKLKDFDLSHPLVQQKLKERYGNNIPMNEKVISPVSIFESNSLTTVFDNY